MGQTVLRCYTCDGGVELSGDATRHCQTDGSWSESAPTCAPVCSDSITQYVEYQGIKYATIENNNPETEDGCQDDRFVIMPVGFKMAVDSEDVRRDVVGTHPWASSCVIFGNGESYYNHGGTACGSDELRTNGNTDGPPISENERDSSTTYGITPGCSRRLLIQCP
jgi:hypothetical protein